MRKRVLIFCALAGALWLANDLRQNNVTTHAGGAVKSAQTFPASALLAGRNNSPEVKSVREPFPPAAAATPLAISDGGPGEPLSASVANQIASLQAAKQRRTDVEKKISSSLLAAERMAEGKSITAETPRLRVNLDKDDAGRVLVDIAAAITPEFERRVEELGGKILNSFPEYQRMRAWIGMENIKTIASLAEVQTIRPAVKAKTNTGSVVTEGDAAHKANVIRQTLGVTGSGVKVGVLSDSVKYLSRSQASSDLGTVTVLPGQAGTGTGEGTAMLEIVHDLAPGASLYFASAMNSPAAFANNIRQLRAAGCDIIVDDVGYFDESPFQDDLVSQAVNAVTSDGALYFSAAGNSGNKRSNQSCTWEGDFSDGGAPAKLTGRLHSFGANSYNIVSKAGSQSYAALFWSDPLGKSGNDYDLYVVSASGQTVIAASDDYQGGTQDPYEFIDQVQSGERLVIVKSAGESRFIHLETGRGLLSVSTDGGTKGHPCAADAFCVAAVDVHSTALGSFGGGSTSPDETFSSDGPRRVFYTPAGQPITPGNLLSTGGSVRQKPDLAAADGVSTSVPGFSPFYGTSAAAPHAAAVAALLKSYKSSLTTKQIRDVLTKEALDNEGTGVDEDSGYGITMASVDWQTLGAQTGPLNTPVPTSPKLSTFLDSANNQLQLRLVGDIGQQYTIESSTDLANWNSIATVTNSTGTAYFQDFLSPDSSSRFYRVAVPPVIPPGV